MVVVMTLSELLLVLHGEALCGVLGLLFAQSASSFL